MKSDIKPIIGIVARSYNEKNGSVLEVNENYRLAVVNAGGIPLLICPTDGVNYGITEPNVAGRLSDLEKLSLYQIFSLCDGFIMTGGERWYDWDETLCQYAYDYDVPLLGICLGMQILANMDCFCDSEVCDKTILNKTSINHCQVEASYVHSNLLFPSKLRQILGVDEIRVNSRHNYHVEKKDWFIVSSQSEDGLIEGIEIPDKKFILGVQWHPESMVSYDDRMQLLFQAFVDAASDFKNQKLLKRL